MANLLIKTRKERGKGIVYTEVCPVSNCNSNRKVEYRVGNPKCCNKNCPHFRKFTIDRNGNRVVHCEPNNK